MPVEFLTDEQAGAYGRLSGLPVHFVGTFVADPVDVPGEVAYVAEQLDVAQCIRGAVGAAAQRAAKPEILRAMARTTIDELLALARAGLVRVEPHEARDAIGSGALMIDIRSEAQRAADGIVPDTIWFARNALEWRCDPSCEAHDDRVGDLERQVILMCDEGYQSSLAAANLQQLGFAAATDLAGGFQAWRAAGLPVMPAQLSCDGAAPAGRRAVAS